MKEARELLVSTIIIFLNAEKFIQEAIESVVTQTYQNWELILVDDGSADASSDLAKAYTRRYPKRLRYLEHPGHENRGKAASRNLGIQNSKGEFIAFLDADDVWLPKKLEEQVELLNSHPNVEVLYGNTIYWHSWTRKPRDENRDYIPDLGITPCTIIEPPELLSRFLRGKAAIPCTCSIIVRRDLATEIRGFETGVVGINNVYEDQAFYAKLCLQASIYVTEHCWDKYRQHPDSSMTTALTTGQEFVARRGYLTWLVGYLLELNITDHELWIALRKELWRNRHYHYPLASGMTQKLDAFVGWIKKWILRFEESIMPKAFSDWFWSRGQKTRYSP